MNKSAKAPKDQDLATAKKESRFKDLPKARLHLMLVPTWECGLRKRRKALHHPSTFAEAAPHTSKI